MIRQLQIRTRNYSKKEFEFFSRQRSEYLRVLESASAFGFTQLLIPKGGIVVHEKRWFLEKYLYILLTNEGFLYSYDPQLSGEPFDTEVERANPRGENDGLAKVAVTLDQLKFVGETSLRPIPKNDRNIETEGNLNLEIAVGHKVAELLGGVYLLKTNNDYDGAIEWR